MVHTALQFSGWALEAVLLPPVCFVFAVAAMSFVLAAWKQRPVQTRLWKPYHWLFLTHLLFFAAAILVAVLLENPVSNPTIPHHASASARVWLDILTYGSLVSYAFWVWRMKGFRWFAFSLMFLAELSVWGALFIAGMSIAGDWL